MSNKKYANFYTDSKFKNINHNAYFNEKYYLNGLKDGIKLMSEIRK